MSLPRRQKRREFPTRRIRFELVAAGQLRRAGDHRPDDDAGIDAAEAQGRHVVADIETEVRRGGGRLRRVAKIDRHAVVPACRRDDLAHVVRLAAGFGRHKGKHARRFHVAQHGGHRAVVILGAAQLGVGAVRRPRQRRITAWIAYPPIDKGGRTRFVEADGPDADLFLAGAIETAFVRRDGQGDIDPLPPFPIADVLVAAVGLVDVLAEQLADGDVHRLGAFRGGVFRQGRRELGFRREVLGEGFDDLQRRRGDMRAVIERAP